MPLLLYQNFDLLLERNGERYRAHVTASPAGEANGFFDLPSLGGSDPRQIGERLFHTIFSNSVGQCLALSWQSGQQAGMGLRIRLRLDENAPELAQLPWELLYSPDWGRFLALSSQTPLLRYLLQLRADPPLLVQPPLRLLVVIAAPLDRVALDGEQEWSLLQSALADLTQQQVIGLERLTPATPTALQDRLRKGDVHLLHFVGHGDFEPASQEGVLYFEDEARQSVPIRASQLAILLGDAAPRLVFLNACQGATSGGQQFFAGVAQQLVTQRIPAVIAMQNPITDAAATLLAHTFYKALADGYPVDAALSEARKAIFTSGAYPELAEWATPILFSRSPDNQLFQLAQTTPPAEPRTQPEFPVPPTFTIGGNVSTGADFIGRDQIIQGDLVQGDKVSGDKIVNIYVAAGEEKKAAAPPLPRQPFEPETILVPAGEFWMGSDEGEPAEQPCHPVTLPAYRIGKYPVTNAQYAEYLKRNPQVAQPDLKYWFQRRPKKGLDNFPVVNLTWQEAQNYCRWLSQVTGRSYALPSEAQWEKAARGTDHRRYPWGDAWDPQCANLNGQQLRAVDAHPLGASVYGVIDLLGNVEEWTTTLWGSAERVCEFPYPYHADDGREESTLCAFRIHRGGSYRSAADALNNMTRSAIHQESKVPWRGLRVVINDL